MSIKETMHIDMDEAGWKTAMLSTYRHKNSLLSAQRIMAVMEAG
jgi:hypothetical protein